MDKKFSYFHSCDEKFRSESLLSPVKIGFDRSDFHSCLVFHFDTPGYIDNYIIPWRENKRICRCIFIDIQRQYTTVHHHDSQSQASRSASQPITGLDRHGSNCFNERKLERIEWMIMFNKMGNSNKKIVFIFRSIFFFTFVLSPRYDIKQK